MFRQAMLCALALFAAAPLAAQEGALLTGVVTAGGAPVPGAEISIAGLVRTAITDTDGAWRLGPVPQGRHEIVVQHIGYVTARVDAHTAAGAPVVVDLTPRPLSLSSLVVTASRRTQQLKDAPVATEVIRSSELRASGSSDLSAVLVEQTGVAIQGGHPVGAGVMLQGLGSERVLVLVDGQPIQGRLSGTLDLARTPVSMVERVEVVKGPQSTLYGSDAMGGVINIITRAPTRGEPRLGAEITGGSRHRLDVGADATGSTGALGWAVDGGRRSVELVPGHAGEAATMATRYDGAAKTEWQQSSSVTLLAGGTFLDERQRWRSGALYNFADNTQWTARAGARLDVRGHRFTPTLYATEFRHLSRRSTLPQPVDGSGEREMQRLIEAELLYAADIRGIAVDAGVEARRESIGSDRVVGADRTLHTVEPFAQLTFGGDSWSIVPGVRHSWSEQWGSHVTPRVAAMVRPVPELALRASVGRGYRAPSFKELYMDFLNSSAGAGYVVRGNESLRPETSSNVSGSVEWAGERMYARAQVFYNRFHDFIETVELLDSAGLRVFTYGNIDDGATWGSELELGATWRSLRAEAGYGWLVAEDRRTGEELPGRPGHSGRLSLSYAHTSGFRATVGGVHTGRTLVGTTDSTDVTRAAFTRIDARVSQTLPWGLQISAGVDNIGAARPEHWPGFAGRQLHMSIGWTSDGTRRD